MISIIFFPDGDETKGVPVMNSDDDGYPTTMATFNYSRRCPVCGSLNLSFQSKIEYGHGDCTFDGWIECGECGSTFAHVGDYGHPTTASELSAWEKFNKLGK